MEEKKEPYKVVEATRLILLFYSLLSENYKYSAAFSDSIYVYNIMWGMLIGNGRV